MLGVHQIIRMYIQALHLFLLHHAFLDLRGGNLGHEKKNRPPPPPPPPSSSLDGAAVSKLSDLVAEPNLSNLRRKRRRNDPKSPKEEGHLSDHEEEEEEEKQEEGRRWVSSLQN